MRAWIAVLLLLCSAGAARGQEVAGRYRLEGVREAAGEIVLRPDGRFEFAFTHGALDQVARGRWTRGGDSVALVSEAGPPPRMVLGSWATAADPGHPAALVVRVSSPEHETVWKEMRVTAEYTGGARREARTGRDGRAALPAVRGQSVRRVRVEDPSGRVPAADVSVDRGARALEIHLLPGSLVRPAFERLTLRVRGPALVVEDEAGRPAMSFVR